MLKRKKKVLVLVAMIFLVFILVKAINRNIVTSPPDINLPENDFTDKDAVIPPLDINLPKYSFGDYEEFIIADGINREYVFHIPQGYDSTKKYPLVFVYHGGGGGNTKVMKQTQFTKKSDEEGFIVVYPNGYKGNWNDGRGTTEAEIAGIDDIKFTKKLVDKFIIDLNIDLNKIYATGPSNGGMMSYRVGCELSDTFTAVAPVIANIPKPIYESCNPNQISILTINGTKDSLVPLEGGNCCKTPRGGGDGGILVSQLDSIKKFVQSNNCDEDYSAERLPVVIDDGTTVEKRTYKCSRNTVSYIVHGMGHVWSPNKPILKFSGKTSHNLNATDVVWNFFKNLP